MSFFKIVTEQTATKATKDLLVVKMDGEKTQTASQFYTQIAHDLSFPDYFGENLDAFFDCVNDLDNVAESQVVIQIQNYALFLSKEDMDFKEDIFGLLHEAASIWERGFNGETKTISLEVFEDEMIRQDAHRWELA